MSIEYFGHLGKIENPFKFFEQNNYLICRGATNLEKIDELVDVYEKSIVPSPYKYLRQSTEWEHNRKTEAGGIANCFLNPHSYIKGINGKFADLILQVLSAQEIQQSLAQISEWSPNFRLFQTMFFDHSTTPAHQDWIYLDSRPNGHLIAAWVALEDIYEEGIRFFVYPHTHEFMPQAKYQKMAIERADDIYTEFYREMNEFLELGDFQMYAPPLQKGDIFFWGSRIVHGSTPGTNPNLRRKSLAAHFVPEGLRFGNLEKDFHISFQKKYNLKYSKNPLDQLFTEHNKTFEQEEYQPSDNKSLEEQFNELNHLYQLSQMRAKQLESEIIAMKTSKFWKMREQWLKLKSLWGY